MKVYLVRHAQAEWWKAPDENRPLTPKGFEDAEELSQILKDHPIDTIYSSPYARAYQTIEPTALKLGLKINIENDLRERKLGENIEHKDFATAVAKTWQDPNFTNPNGESNADAQKRAVACLRKLQAKHPNESIALASHGNIIALILQAFDPTIGFEFWKSLSMPDVYALDFTDEQKPEVSRIFQEK